MVPEPRNQPSFREPANDTKTVGQLTIINQTESDHTNHNQSKSSLYWINQAAEADELKNGKSLLPSAMQLANRAILAGVIIACQYLSPLNPIVRNFMYYW